MRRLLVIAALGLFARVHGDDEGAPRARRVRHAHVRHGYTDYEADSLNALLDQWNAENPDIR
jgi:hypothetical protein